MDRAALLAEFGGRVDEFDKYQTFIDKANSQQGKFAPAVIEKVIKDNTEKCQNVASEVLPLTSDVDAVIAELSDERQKVLDSKGTSELQLQELELRLMIGELDDAGFEAEGKALREAIASVDSRVQVFDVELDQFKALMARWLALGEKSGVLAPQKPTKKKKESEAPKAPDEQKTAAERRATTPTADEEADEVEAFAADEEEDEKPAAKAKSADSEISDDLSSVLGDDEPFAAAEEEEDEEEEEEEEEEEDDKPRGRAAAIEKNEIDILGDDDAVASEPEAAAGGDEFRRAVLLYQEGTAEEQIYPFNGDTMTLGRGRDNDIQVKNDSKVSRYHCKLYRRGPNFYIEDNKSANGSLVNGELITERRLFGGEEIIIGETFFRFRIMD